MSMKIDIDSLSADISNSLAQESLQKALPPRLAYRLRAWFKRFHPNLGQAKQATNMIAQKIEEACVQSELKKNEMMATAYSNATVRLDFGTEIPESVKKSVMAWAKRKGLKAVEASLTKSQSAKSFITYTSNTQASSPGQMVSRVKWAIS